MCRVVQSITGRPREPDDRDAQHHGQRMSGFIHRYSAKIAPLTRQAKVAFRRRELQGKATEGWDSELKAAEEQ
eukprot:6829670-Prymnesium_polylepis.1